MTAPAVRVAVLAKPRAKKSRVVSAEGLAVAVQLAAAPVDGAANEELVEVLALALGMPKGAVRLVIGASSKRKVVEVVGLEADEVARRLSGAVK